MHSLRALLRATSGQSRSAADWPQLVFAQAELVRAQALVWMHPTAWLVQAAGGGGAHEAHEGDESAIAYDAATREEVRRIARSVRRVADHGLFRPKCLARAVGLHYLLARRGVMGSRVRVGVRRRDDAFEAHAWVELHGRVVGEEATHAASFTQIVDLRGV